MTREKYVKKLSTRGWTEKSPEEVGGERRGLWGLADAGGERGGMEVRSSLVGRG